MDIEQGARCEDCAWNYYSQIERAHVCGNPDSPFSYDETDPDGFCYEFSRKEEE